MCPHIDSSNEENKPSVSEIDPTTETMASDIQTLSVEIAETEFSLPSIRLRFQFAMSCLFLALPTVLFLLLRKVSQVNLPRSFLPLIAFPINIAALYFFFYRKFGIPIKAPTFPAYLARIGLQFTTSSYPNIPPSQSRLNQILLGILLGSCSLVGMLIGSILTGRYQFDISRLTSEQVLFALVPSVWEELFFRAFIMFVLLRVLKNPMKTIIVQSIIFGAFHIQGFEFWQIIDMLTVIPIGFAFTYVVYRTNSLIPAIIFHFLHDAFIFVVQAGDDVIFTNGQNAIFYAAVWLSQAIICGIAFMVTQRHKSWIYDLTPYMPPQMAQV